MIQFFPNEQTFLMFSIGGLTFDIRWYAVLIMTGAACAYYFCLRSIKESRYIRKDFFDNLFIYTLWAGIIGARLWFCTFYNFSYYMSDPLEIIKIWDGGLAIQGGLVFGALFAYWYAKKNRYPFMKLLDIILPNVMLAQSIGRWGNYVNRECHGAEVGAEYFDGILSFLKDGMYIDGHYYEPMFFYESVLCLIGWAVIMFVLRKRQNKRGDLACAYLMWYGVIRFFIEARRTDSLYLGNLKMAQVTSVVFVILGLLGYIGVFNKILKKDKPTLFFDFDGTLMDTRQCIVEAYRSLFRKYSDESKFTPEIQDEIIGPALRDLFPKYFPGIDYDTLYADYRKTQIEVTKKTTHPTPNSLEVLKTLHDGGYKIAIISTRTSKGIKELTDEFGMSEYIDDVCGLNDVTKLKPDPEGIFDIVERNKWNRECVMIGDSLMDMGCGSNYGAYNVAYISEPSRKEELEKASNVTIEDMKELLPVLDQDISFTYDNR